MPVQVSCSEKKLQFILHVKKTSTISQNVVGVLRRVAV